MNKVLIINTMLYTAPLKGRKVPVHKSIKDCMIITLCRGFLNIGCNVTLIASEEYRPINEEYFGFDIIYFRNSIKKFIPRFSNGMPVLSGLRRWLKRHQSEYDVIICSELMTFATMTAASICPQKVKVWQEFADHHPALFRVPSVLWYNTLVRCFISWNNIPVIARSLQAARFASKYCSNVISGVVNNCVDGEVFKPSENKHNILICIARLIKNKGVDHVIEAFLKYKKKYNDNITKLYIAGDGEMLDDLISMSAGDPQVIFKGVIPHSELSSLLSSSKGFLIASKGELNCVSITESIVSGVPVLTNSKSLQADFIRDNRLGIVKDDWNEDDIRMLLDLETEYSQNCVRVRSLLTNDSVALQLLNA